MKNIVIGISEGSKYFNYENWIRSEPGVEIIKAQLPLRIILMRLKNVMELYYLVEMISIQDYIINPTFLFM